MKLNVSTDLYVVAISGGVDSVVLLDMLVPPQNLSGAVGNQIAEHQVFGAGLSNRPEIELIIAHFNHGIREDSVEDEKLVARTANKYGLPLEIGRAKLGKSASEEQAREARYNFLRQIKKKHGAKAIITAHHQDDLIETAFINLLRGTGRRGLTAIAQSPDILRPLLDFSKKDILKYAKNHKLVWREDESNQDTRYLRNYIRLRVIPRLSAAQRRELLEHINKLNRLNPLLDQKIAIISQSLLKGDKINRQKFIALPPEVATESLVHILRQEEIRQYDKKTLERLCLAIKTAKPGTKHDVQRGISLEITRSFAHLNVGVRV